MSIGGGIERKGKTKGKQLGVDGPAVSTKSQFNSGNSVGKKNSDMKAVGRGMAKIRAQKGG